MDIFTGVTCVRGKEQLGHLVHAINGASTKNQIVQVAMEEDTDFNFDN